MLSQRLATYRQFVNNGIKYFFPSSLHRWYVEWKLWGITDATSFDCADVLELVINVIFYFLSTRSLNPTRHRPWRCSTSTGSPISGRILPLLSYLFLFQELARIICRIRHGERPSGFSHPSKKKWGGWKFCMMAISSLNISGGFRRKRGLMEPLFLCPDRKSVV